MINLNRVPLIEGLKLYQEEANIRFHMPGHRHEDRQEELALLQKNLYDFDVTEVPGTDNLHYPEGILKRSEELLSLAMQSKESLYCINGSTASNYAMVFGLFREGDKVLVQRNCHQSIYNAFSLARLRPVYLMPEFIPSFGLLSSVSYEEILAVYRKNPDAKGIVLTSPSYFGIAADIGRIATFCDEKGIYLVVDEAHGAHFPFSSLLPESSMVLGAHASAVSFHKTLPSMTQGAVLNLSGKLSPEEAGRIRYYHRVFQSSSPSYPLMASMEMARYMMEEQGETLYRELFQRLDKLKGQLALIDGLEVLGRIPGETDFFDETRLVIHTPLEGEVLNLLLREKHHIQCEMTRGHNIVFIITPFNTQGDLSCLGGALKEILEDARKEFSLPEEGTTEDLYDKEVFRNSLQVIPETEALFMAHETVEFDEAIGRISFEKVVPYPPGIPLLIPGERISKEAVTSLRRMYQYEGSINRSSSQKENHIQVIQEEGC